METQKQANLSKKEVADRENQVYELSTQLQMEQDKVTSLKKQLIQEAAEKNDLKVRLQIIETALAEERKLAQTPKLDVQSIKDDAQRQIVQQDLRVQELTHLIERLESEKTKLEEMKISKEAIQLKEAHDNALACLDRERDKESLEKAQLERARDLEVNRARQAVARLDAAQTKFKVLLKAAKIVVRTQGGYDGRKRSSVPLEQSCNLDELDFEEDDEGEEEDGQYKELLAQLQQLQEILPDVFNSRQRECDLIQSHAAEDAKVRQDYESRITELQYQVEDLETTLAKAKAAAEGDRATLSRQLFVLQSNLVSSKETIERISKELLQVCPFCMCT